MDTPSKKPYISIMAHEEEEEMQHDISKLGDQVQQILLSQRVTKNELEVMTNVNMDGLKRNMEGFKDGLETKMEDLKDGLKA